MHQPSIFWGEINPTRRLTLACLVVLCGTTLLDAGCGSSQSTTSADSASARLTVLTKHYVAHMNSHNNQPPASEAEFKQILTEAGAGVLKRAGAATVDELFLSPHDGQPFVIGYGKAAAALVNRGIIAYEKAGNDGQRLIGYRLGFVEAVDDEKFRSLVPKP